MKNAFIIHGAFGSPEENWIPWLTGELESRGYEVTVPKFPTPEGQTYDNWQEVIQPHLSQFAEDSVLIGHSIGATFLFCILERLSVPVAKTVLVSGFAGLLDNEEFDSINHTISDRDFNWEMIKANSKEFVIFHGTNDPYVPKGKPEFLAQQLAVPVQWVENGGHLNKAAGFKEFPQLLEKVIE